MRMSTIMAYLEAFNVHYLNHLVCTNYNLLKLAFEKHQTKNHRINTLDAYC